MMAIMYLKLLPYFILVQLFWYFLMKMFLKSDITETWYMHSMQKDAQIFIFF